MSSTKVDERFRLTLPKNVRKSLKIRKGQPVYIIASGDTIIVKVIDEDPSEKLAKILGDFKFDRKARRRSEEWLLRGAQHTTS